MVVHPTCRPADHFYIVAEGAQIVAIGHMRSSEFYSHIGRCESRTVEVFLVVDIYDTYNLMSTADGYFFYHFTHLSVTY